MSALPIIDVGALVRRVGCSSTKLVAARAIDRACRDTGFFYVCNHGVDEVLRARVLELGRRFFELPQASKDAISIANSSSFRGYQRMGENVTQGLPDWHEGIDWFRDEEGQPLPPGMDWFQLAGANQWPSEVEVPGFRAAYGAYVSCMLDLGGAVMRGVALGLGKEAHFFEPWYTRSFWVMRLIGYPTLSGGDGGGGGGGGSGNGGDGSGGGGGGGGGVADDRLQARGAFDLVLGCEVVFSAASARGVARSLAHLVRRGGRGMALVASATAHSRYGIDTLRAAVAEEAPWLRCVEVRSLSPPEAPAPPARPAAAASEGQQQQQQQQQQQAAAQGLSAEYWRRQTEGLTGAIRFELYAFTSSSETS